MRRIRLVLAIAALMATMVATTALPASAKTVTDPDLSNCTQIEPTQGTGRTHNHVFFLCPSA